MSNQTAGYSSKACSMLLCRSGDVPGLDELYLTTMDTIESITPNDALFMLQGSVLSKATGTGGRQNKVGLSAGKDCRTLTMPGLGNHHDVVTRYYSWLHGTDSCMHVQQA